VVSTVPPPQESSAEKRRKRLASYTVRNMVYSMLPVVLLAMVWWSITYNPQEQQYRPVPVDSVSSFAVEQADWPVWVPDPGEDWTATVAWFDARVEGVPTWHISYESPAGEYVALHQAAEVTDGWLDQVLSGAQVQGEVLLPGPAGEQRWESWAGEPRSNAEVGYRLPPGETGGSTVVLHGTADQGEFEDFLDAVQARGG
jgi:hypothetical protein